MKERFLENRRLVRVLAEFYRVSEFTINGFEYGGEVLLEEFIVFFVRLKYNNLFIFCKGVFLKNGSYL